jgi:superfamily I DNA/RNA helicase
MSGDNTDRIEKTVTGTSGGEVAFWQCGNERAQAQAVAAEIERLVAREDVAPEDICVLVRSVRNEGQAVAVALEERAVPHRLAGAAAFFQRAEVRDVLAWLRLLVDPGDAGAVVRALARAPIGLRSIGFVGKLLYEAIEEVDTKQVEAIEATGASGDENSHELPQFIQEGRRIREYATALVLVEIRRHYSTAPCGRSIECSPQ